MSDKAEIAYEEKKKDSRGEWGNPIEFILACVGYAVGLGNVWRFPYLCFRNGGGAFLIPYVISLLIAGLPIFFLELVLGQFTSLGPNMIFTSLAPAFQGIGYGMVVCSFLVAIYYNMIIAWVLYYFVASFRGTMLWASCLNPWNTADCDSNLEIQACEAQGFINPIFYNKTCWNNSFISDPKINASYLKREARSPAEEYFTNEVLNMSQSFEDIGPLQWKLVLALLGAWIVIFFCLIKGVKSTGKVVYFTATFPYVVLVILLIRGATLPGAYKGIEFYIKPNMTKLLEISVWKDAAIQIFYSLGPAFGGLLTMSSYNKFHNNCHRDALIVAFTNCLTSVFAGFAVFSIAGFMAADLQVEVEDVVRDGTGLAFIAYPEAISRMPAPYIWAILFFFMLFTLGLDSQFAMVETCSTAVMDQFPKLRRRKWAVIGTMCAVSFLLGLPLCARGGIYIFTAFNDYSAGWNLIALAFLETVVVMWFYGMSQRHQQKGLFAIVRDVEMMLGVKNSPLGRALGSSSWYWRITWLILTPLFLLMILIFTFVFYKPSAYSTYTFTGGAEAFGYILSLLSIMMVPIFAIYNLYKNRRKGEPLSNLIKPTVDWCPAHEREKKRAEAKMHQLHPYVVPSAAPTAIPYSPNSYANPTLDVKY